MSLRSVSARLSAVEVKLTAFGLLQSQTASATASARIDALEAAISRAEASTSNASEGICEPSDRAASNSCSANDSFVDSALLLQADTRITKMADALSAIEAARSGTDGGAFDTLTLIEAESLRLRVAGAVRGALEAVYAASRQRAKTDAALAAYGALVDAGAALALAAEARLRAKTDIRSHISTTSS